jgi:hypothetical protein
MSITNFFVVPSGLTITQFACKSGNVYTPVNNIITNVAQVDIADVLAMGARQASGPDSGATLPWVAGRFYQPMQGATPGTLLTVASTIYAYPIRVPNNIPIQTISADVTTGQTGGQVRFGLYTDLNGAPSTLVSGSDSGNQTATGTDVATFTPSSPISLNEGWYWAALVAAATSTMPTVAALAAGYAADSTALIGQDTAAHAFASSGESVSGVTATLTFGALPTTFPTAGYALALNAATPVLVFGT